MNLPDKIVLRPLGQLIPYARNARTHDDAQVAQIAASLREFGWTNPVLIDGDGGIIAGHGRVLAARKLGITDIPCIELAHLTETQRRAYILADNQLALNAEWDNELLKIELADLKLADFDLELTGFGKTEIDALLTLADPDADPADGDEDESSPELPDPPADPITRLGDVWLLGHHHRVCCGDSTSPDAVQVLMGGDRASLCVTSPPYGQQRDYGAAKAHVQDWDGLMQGVFARLADVMTPEGQVLVNLGLIHRDNEWQPYWQDWIAWMRTQGWRRFGWYVWDQGPGMMGDWAGRLAPSFEFVFHFNRAVRKPNKFIQKIDESILVRLSRGGIRRSDGVVPELNNPELGLQTHKIPDNVLRIMRHKGTIGDGISHPAVFPVALPEFLMQAYTDAGEIVYEPFGGSGTTVLAGERCGRPVRAMELDPAYVDVICQRWRQAGYPPAVHADTGEEFPDE